MSYSLEPNFTKTTFWNGVLFWEDKKSQRRHEMECDVFTLSVAHSKALTKIQWPLRLRMKLMDKAIMSSLDLFIKSSKIVKFSPYLADSPSFLSLVSDLCDGCVGFVELTHQQTPFNKQGLILTCSSLTKILKGFVPDQQMAFMEFMQKREKEMLCPSPTAAVLTHSSHSTERSAENVSSCKKERTENCSPAKSSNGSSRHNASAVSNYKKERTEDCSAAKSSNGPSRHNASAALPCSSNMMDSNPAPEPSIKREVRMLPHRSTTSLTNVSNYKKERTEDCSAAKYSNGPSRHNASAALPCSSNMTDSNPAPEPSIKSEVRMLPHRSTTSLTNEAEPVVREQSSPADVDRPSGWLRYGSRSSDHNRSRSDQPPEDKRRDRHRVKSDQHDRHHHSRSRSPRRRSPNGSHRRSRKYRRHRSPKRQRSSDKIISKCDSTNTNPCDVTENRNSPIITVQRQHHSNEQPAVLTGSSGNLHNSNNAISDHHNEVKPLYNASYDSCNRSVYKSEGIRSKNIVNEIPPQIPQQVPDLQSSKFQQVSTNSNINGETMDFVLEKEIKTEIVDDESNVQISETNQQLSENTARGSEFTFSNTQESSVSCSEVLGCSSCNQLILSKDIHLCNCQVLCSSCISQAKVNFVDKCLRCETPFNNSSMFNNFYKRVLTLLERPCRNKVMGCMYSVKPGDLHEDSCSFEPIQCIVCEQNVQKILLCSHFQLEHPGQYLTNSNPSVLIGRFSKDPVVESYHIYCFLSVGEPVKITLNNIKSEDNFATFIVEGENEPNTRTTFKFIFTVCDMYSRQISVKLTNNRQEALQVPKDLVEHWLAGLSSLKINVSRKEIEVGKSKAMIKKT